MKIPSHFKLANEHPASYEIHDSRDGSTFHVAKSGLDLGMHGALSTIQKFAEGGETVPVASDPSQINIEPESEQPQMQVEAIPERAPASQGVPASAEAVTQPAKPTLLPDTSGGIETLKKTIQTESGKEAEFAQKSAQAYDEYNKWASSRKSVDELQQEGNQTGAALQKAFTDGTIDPNRVWHKAGTGAKIAASIGMLFGGIGAAMAGTPNYALQTIESAIDRDIDAQKNDKSNAYNAWKMNREITGDNIQAELATRAQHMEAVKSLISSYAAAAGGSEAKIKAAQMIGTLDTQLQTNRWMQSVTSGSAHPGSEGEYSNNMKVMQQLRPDMYKDMEDKYVPGLGVARTKLTDDNKKAFIKYDQLIAQLDDAIASNVETGQVAPFGLSQAAQISRDKRMNIIQSMNDLHGLTRAPGGEMLDMYKEQIPEPGSWRHDTARAKLQEVKDAVLMRKQAEMMGLGVVPFKKPPDDATALRWAQSNMNDPMKGPKARAIIQQLGGT